MSTAADLWTEFKQLKAGDAPVHLQGRVYERWFAQAIREGNDPSRLRRDAPTLEERIDARIIEGLDGCLIWDGAMSHRNQPEVNAPKTGRHVSVRRWLLARDGRPANPRRRVYAKCGNHRCVALDHLAVEEEYWLRTYGEDAIRGRLQIFALRHGHPPSTTDWHRTSAKPVRDVIIGRFGSWAKALRAAGLEASEIEHPKTPLAERSHCVHGHPVTAETLESNGHGSAMRCKTCRSEKREAKRARAS